MAKIAAKLINYALNAVPLEDEASSLALNVAVETPPVTGLSDAGPRRVQGNYDWSVDIEGFGDFVAAQGDATIFAQIVAGTAVTSAFDPTGATAGANDPNYDGSVLTSAYSIRGAVGGPVTYTATFQGATALSRAVA